MADGVEVLTGSEVGTTTADPAPPSAKKPSAHQPALDGLRGIAVAAVVFFHATSSSTTVLGRGGFLGVDLFFVLSGYLITGLLLTEFKGSNRVDIRAFWLRRFRRLFPAIVVTLVLVALYIAISPSWQRSGIRNDTIWTLLYVQNWHILYWDHAGFTPLSHTWSLSVEEQWYLVWPTALWATLRWAKGRLRIVLSIVIGLALASALWTSVLYSGRGWPRAYNGTDTRAQELLIGAGLAVLFQSGALFITPGIRKVLEVAGWCGGAFILYEILVAHSSDAFLYRGGFLAFSIATGLVIAAATHADGLLGRSLSWRPLALLGLISYGVYLFHVPIFDMIGPGRWGLNGFPLFIVRIFVVIAVAAISYYVLENPIRRRTLRMSNPSILIPGLICGGLGLAIIFVFGNPPSPTLLTQHFIDEHYAAPAHATRLMVVGEWPTFDLDSDFPEGFGSHTVDGISYGLFGCGFGSGNVVAGQQQFPPNQTCTGWAPIEKQAVDIYQPDVVALVVGDMEIFDRVDGTTSLPVGSAPWTSSLFRNLDQARLIAQNGGGRVVVVSSLCPDMTSTLPALAPQNADPNRYAEVANAVAQYGVTRKVSVLQLGDLLCPGGQPLREAHGNQVSSYNNGLTKAGSLLVWQWLTSHAGEVTATQK